MFDISLGLRLRAAAVLCLSGLALLVWHPWTSVAAAAGDSPTEVIIQKLSYRRGEPARGTRVTVPSGSRRVFVNARDGFTFVSVRGELTPARSTDGGATWSIDGPGVFTEGAADAPLTVEDFDAENASTFYAYGGGQVVDITSDGGRVWRQVIFQGLETSVAPTDHGLAAYVDDDPSTGPGSTIQFYSANGGSSWRVVKGFAF